MVTAISDGFQPGFRTGQARAWPTSVGSAAQVGVWEHFNSPGSAERMGDQPVLGLVRSGLRSSDLPMAPHSIVEAEHADQTCRVAFSQKEGSS